jgi:DNA primase
MPRLSAEKINEIRQSVDIVDVIGNYLSLQKKGRNYVSLCPFHDDSHPSMSISPERQIYMCFVCHNGGNVFTFLKNYLKIPYIEAVKMVASMGNIDISEYNLEKRVQPVEQKFEPLYKMHDEANKIYNHYLNTKLAIDAKEYLTKRKITDEIIDMFEIGYAPSNNILLK